MSERSISSCESLARSEDNYGYSIKNVIFDLDDDKYFKTNVLFTKRSEKKMFMTLEKVKQICANILTAQSRQNSYTDK
jgi:hypothetical protein